MAGLSKGRASSQVYNLEKKRRKRKKHRGASVQVFKLYLVLWL
jgi:predicted transcriptional regulator